MTRIKYRNGPVWHETGLFIQGRAIVVAESPCNLLLRLKGTRQRLELPWTMAFLRAAALRAAVDRLDRINRKRRSKSS